MTFGTGVGSEIDFIIRESIKIQTIDQQLIAIVTI